VSDCDFGDPWYEGYDPIKIRSATEKINKYNWLAGRKIFCLVLIGINI
jgi:hypothetical protein